MTEGNNNMSVKEKVKQEQMSPQVAMKHLMGQATRNGTAKILTETATFKWLTSRAKKR
jgi:hypothetical protein